MSIGYTNDYEREEIAAYCALPILPPRALDRIISSAHEELIRYIEKVWVNGTELHYYYFRNGPFMGDQAQIEIVEKGFEVWRNVGIGITFSEVTSIGDAEIRIGFEPGVGSWSYVGRDVIDIPGQQERTMNFGWDLQADPRGVDVPVHEIGHTLGFPHEHQNPFSGIVWNEPAVYEYFRRTQSWLDEKIHHNVLRKLSQTEVEGSKWDPDSIMHYAFAPGLITQPTEYHAGLKPKGGLSPEDIRRARMFYPPLNKSHFPLLEPFKSRSLNLDPAQQVNYIIKPPETREYQFSTFGESDVVMALFENQKDGLRYVAGNDNSNVPDNAFLKAKLYRGSEYVLRIRMYLTYGTHVSAVMVW